MKHTNPRKKESSFIKSICVICNKYKQQSKGTCKKTGKTKYTALCKRCILIQKGIDPAEYFRIQSRNRVKKEFKYRSFKKSFCEECGFIAKVKYQLDVHHIDGNHKNNDPINLQTLCANCHRLKTFIHLIET